MHRGGWLRAALHLWDGMFGVPIALSHSFAVQEHVLGKSCQAVNMTIEFTPKIWSHCMCVQSCGLIRGGKIRTTSCGHLKLVWKYKDVYISDTIVIHKHWSHPRHMIATSDVATPLWTVFVYVWHVVLSLHSTGSSTLSCIDVPLKFKTVLEFVRHFWS